MRLYLDSGAFIETDFGIDVSLPLTNDSRNPRAWYVDPPRMEPVRANGFVGSVAEGGSVNFRDVFFNPHGHGTHTECCGHITPEVYSINDALKQFFFTALVVSITPETQGNDLVITAKQLELALNGRQCEALLVRSLPNDPGKKHRNYSSTNPPYFEAAAVEILNQAAVLHFLTDLPSVDREDDGGALAFHHAFWQVPQNPQHHKTISELIFIPDHVADGHYILNLQCAPFVNDAAPSRPVLFEVRED